MGTDRSFIKEDKPLRDFIPKFHKRISYELIMFGYVKGQLSLIPNMTVNQALRQYAKTFDISESQFAFNSMRKYYEAMDKEYYQTLKT